MVSYKMADGIVIKVSPTHLSTIQSMIRQPKESCQHLSTFGAANHRRPELTLLSSLELGPSASTFSVMNPTFFGSGSARSSTAYETMDHRVAAVYENCVRLFPRFSVRARNDGV